MNQPGEMTATDVQRGLTKLGGQLPETMGAFARLHGAAMRDGALDASVKELMALAVAIAAGCSGCIAYHVERALAAGASREQALEAVGVAVLMGGGPAAVHGTEALAQLDRAPA